MKVTTTTGFLADGLVLYGDNAYVNCQYMAGPFLRTTSGAKDNFNLYHSQVCINIECAFGLLTNRWRVRRSPLRTMSIKKVVALTSCLCRLHNFCINNTDKAPPSIQS